MEETPVRQKVVRGRKVEECLRVGSLVVFVDNHAVQTSFDVTCETIESGGMPNWAGPKLELAPTETAQQTSDELPLDTSRDKVRYLLLNHAVLRAAVMAIRMAFEKKHHHANRKDQIDLDVAQILIAYNQSMRNRT